MATASAGQWVAGARPRTLPASIVPVAIGTAVGSLSGPFELWRAVAAGIVSLGLQVGVNYANDYSDGIRGTDNARVGPLRLVGSGLASPGAVKRAAFGAFGVAALAGLILAASVSWWLLLVGLAAMLAAWGYTGGPRPYGYAGLGEVFVFVFFGLVATGGSAYVQDHQVNGLTVLAAFPVGLLAVALLVVNNLRDRSGDADAGKRTLAVRLGAVSTRRLYAGCLASTYVFAVVDALSRPWALICLLSAPLAVPAARLVLSGAEGGELIDVLGRTGRLQLAFGALLALGLVL